MKNFADAASTPGWPWVVQTVFWPPFVSSVTSAEEKLAAGGGTGMNGALHAQSPATKPSAAPRRASCFFIIILFFAGGVAAAGKVIPRSKDESNWRTRATTMISAPLPHA